jgi:uncharacterized protein
MNRGRRAVSVTVQDNPTESRYEVCVDDQRAGFTEYNRYRNEIAFIHTETAPEFAGQGLARRLVQDALDDVRKQGLTVLPYCPYVRGFIVRNPQYLDLVPEDQHERFGLSRN